MKRRHNGHNLSIEFPIGETYVILECVETTSYETSEFWGVPQTDKCTERDLLRVCNDYGKEIVLSRKWQDKAEEFMNEHENIN